jgi:hypothetical protein
VGPQNGPTTVPARTGTAIAWGDVPSALMSVVVLTVVTVGCSVGPVVAPADPGTWLARHGGPADPALLPRVEAATRRLAPEGEGGIHRVLVAATDRVGAWSWPDGTVLLTRAVVEGLDDDEIAAVLAHESGHLAEDATDAAPRDRSHRSPGAPDEEAADRSGALMLATRGIDPAAMPRMLRTVAKLAGAETSCGRAALQRAAILEGLTPIDR